MPQEPAPPHPAPPQPAPPDPAPPGPATPQPAPPQPAQSAEQPAEALSDSFWAVARQLRHQSRATLAPWDISPSHSRAIVVLMRHGIMRLSELSEHLGIAPRSTTEVVDALEERGLAQRTADPNDRRATLVSLTDEGADVGRSIRSSRTAESERFFGTLSATDQAHLARILRSLRDAIP